ncbi:MAG: flagellar motor switch protein FliN [Clostridia bacterium]|jgi:flagellar motor switch protein FliN/FliY|nr:flagellar motor switch protein FliN [Clostridia bacterium]MCI1999866.1 flagellar motor switch protein FliN [Clostridia bacterium]MCI2014218.1 flagellar motor switch protein FliN [Clostridia bacterium]
MESEIFSSLEIDAIGEILNISLGASATAVSTLLNRRVDITIPTVVVSNKQDFEFSYMEPAVGVEIVYLSGLSGKNIMLLKQHDVKVIVEILMGTEIPDDEFELNDLNLSAVREVMNQMMGASSTALSEFLGEAVNISTPTSYEINTMEEFKEKYLSDEKMVVVRFSLKIEDAIESEFLNIMTIDLAKKLLACIGVGSNDTNNTNSTPNEVHKDNQTDNNKPSQPQSNNEGKLSQEEIEKLMAGNQENEQTSEPEKPPETEPSNPGKMLSQEEIEKLMSGAQGNEQANEPEKPPETKSSDSGKMLSQEEIEKLMAGAQENEQTSEPEKPPETKPSEPSNSNRKLSQEEIEKLINAGPASVGNENMTNVPKENNKAQPNAVGDINRNATPQATSEQPRQHVNEKREPNIINVKPNRNDEIQEAVEQGEEKPENLDLIMDVPLEISVEIGRTKKCVKEILEYGQGSLVVLDKLAGDQVDVYVNGQCIAKGDVVVVDDCFGVRITEVLKKAKL